MADAKMIPKWASPLLAVIYGGVTRLGVGMDRTDAEIAVKRVDGDFRDELRVLAAMRT